MIRIIAVLLSLAIATPAAAGGWAYFRAHIHRTGQCGGAREVGASVYSEPGKKTYTGARFDGSALRAATSKVDGWPMGATVHIRNPRNGRTVTVVINDRLPMGDAYRSGVRLDLTPAAHRALGMKASDWVCAS